MAQTGSNIPCPCGSGKPLKDCCFAEPLNAIKNEFLSRVSNQDAPLTKDTITQIAREIGKKQQAYNAKPVDDFDGLSPEAMHQLLYSPIEGGEVVRINPTPESFSNAPIHRLFTLLVKEIKEQGIKATARGNLGRSACRHIAEQYFTEEEYKEMTRFAGINMEEDFRELAVLRFVSSTAGLVRKYKGSFILSRKCKKLSADGKDAEIYFELLKTFCTRYNWAYGDGCVEHPFFQRSYMFTLYLLHMLREEIAGDSAPQYRMEDERYIRRCLTIRVIDRFAQFFGFVEIEEVGKDILERKRLITKTPLLDEMFSFRI